MPKIVTTEDGTITCFDEAIGQHYHNIAGAYSEAMVTYVKPSALIEKSKTVECLSILDVPFGLGYNTFALLQALATESSGSKLKRVDIIGIEIDPEVMALLNQVMNHDCFTPLRSRLADADDWLEKLSNFQACECSIGETNAFIQCIRADMRKEVLGLAQRGLKFDAVFHDPFSAGPMPELWTLELFQLYRDLVHDDGCVLTYSSAAAVRGACREAGFSVYKTAALGGKSGGTIASACSLSSMPPGISPLSDAEEERLKTSSAIPYRDLRLTSSREDIVERRRLEQRLYSRIESAEYLH